MSLSPATSALTEYLNSLGVQGRSPAGEGIRRAVGAGPGEDLTDAGTPVYGFFLQSLSRDARAPMLLIYLVTAGRLIRYEWSKDASLTTTVPVDRVTSVDELVAGDTVTLSVNLDSHAVVTLTQTRTTPAEAPAGGTVAESASRSEGVTYRLEASGAEDVLMLAEFSRALRLVVGA